MTHPTICCCVCIRCHGNLFTETLPSDRNIAQKPNHCLAIGYRGELCSAGIGTNCKNIAMGPDGIRNQERRCSRGTALICWTVLEPRMTVLTRASSDLSHLSQPVVVGSQSRRAETWELEDLITEPLPSNCHLHSLL